jgi:nitrogen regulatory protein PII
MRKKSLRFLGIAALMALAVFVGTGCPTDSDSEKSGESSVTKVTVSPATAVVAPNKTKQFTAAVEVSGDAATTVTWKVEGTGKKEGTTISTAGLLTVAADETATALTVTATSTADAAKFGTATVTVSSDSVTSVTVSPTTATVAPGKTKEFTAAVQVTGTLATTVTWKVEGTGKKEGTTISETGVLTVAADETATTLTVTATSTVDAAKSGTATVTVSSDPVGSISVSIGFEGEPTLTGAAAEIVLSKSGAGNKPKTLALSATGYTTPTWYVDGGETGTTGDSITLDAANLEVRNHSVSFTGVKDGVLYAKEIPFSVIE